MEKDTAQQLETALALAQGASEYLLRIARMAADNAAAEIQASDALQDMLSGKHDMAPVPAAQVLSQAIQAAERFPSLKVSSPLSTRDCNHFPACVLPAAKIPVCLQPHLITVSLECG